MRRRMLMSSAVYNLRLMPWLAAPPPFVGSPSDKVAFLQAALLITGSYDPAGRLDARSLAAFREATGRSQ